MFIEAGNILLIGSILLLISVIAGKTTNRLGVPTLIFFLIVGVLAGSEGIGGIHFEPISMDCIATRADCSRSRTVRRYIKSCSCQNHQIVAFE